ncbi:hypothetical protein AVEN_55935-1 [Araneus ventricosus]|uniref:Uncharacterized protein n=1 Tax=Araneus ventricosus TaxID=182803 RepID=A0A4Y2M054_ARAVE|nr:hypothetical protein AVEN_55935-1 [Araneus ventricosus]
MSFLITSISPITYPLDKVSRLNYGISSTVCTSQTRYVFPGDRDSDIDWHIRERIPNRLVNSGPSFNTNYELIDAMFNAIAGKIYNQRSVRISGQSHSVVELTWMQLADVWPASGSPVSRINYFHRKHGDLES